MHIANNQSLHHYICHDQIKPFQGIHRLVIYNLYNFNFKFKSLLHKQTMFFCKIYMNIMTYTEIDKSMICIYNYILYTNIDHKLGSSLHQQLNCVIVELDYHVITTEYRTHVQCVYTCITYFAMHWSLLFISKFQVNIRIQY